ncbi:hypothetical protein [Caulobacter sp. 17J65-9]|uniref:hypothetical protein n=1 Tax=Caulobacter sp. 17J65-9 TaxID=2709382 RepID=UPI0013CB867F|nr:hypothetical protein [Caulobacter sp. 17J65-9]NEX91823.1 hypothetical protein [Caulobacter sp. 17J65-9]
MADTGTTLPNLTGAYDVRAKFDPRSGVWTLRRLVCPPNGDPKWVALFESGTGPYGRPVIFEEGRAVAEAAAEEARRSLMINLDPERLNESGASSQSLKISKAVVSRKRLDEEEDMMRSEAIKRHAATPRIPVEALVIDPNSQIYREEIITKTREMPYLRTMMVGTFGSRAVVLSKDGVSWGRPWRRFSAHDASVAVRAEISEGFGFGPRLNWSTTKAEIRRVLLPRANELLKLASVKRLLDEALAAGKRALVIGSFVFWYEAEGQVGWVVKALGSSKASDAGDTVWEAGKIVSKNHGRIVVLPYVKENGEHVSGYTKNAAGDGPALPRHPAHYVEIPFDRLEGDAMIKLMGELPYE